jgi:hypothetical protein
LVTADDADNNYGTKLGVKYAFWSRLLI